MQAIGIFVIFICIIGLWIKSKITSAEFYCNNFGWKSIRDFCKTKPYYKRLYETILYQETNKHLVKKLKKIAKDKAEKLCKQQMKNLKQNELHENGGLRTDVEETWTTISKSHFYMSEIPEDRITELMMHV